MVMGTGLPRVATDAITPLVDMSALGSGERASAAALEKLASGLRGLHETVLAPQLRQQARRDAADAVSRGAFEEALPITEYGAEYNEALTTGTMARYALDDDRALDGMMASDPYDAETFERASESYLSNSMTGTPGVLAIPRAERFRQRRNELLGNMRIAAARRDVQEASVFITGRIEDLEARLIQKAEAAAAFTEGDTQFAGPLMELSGLYDQMAANPVLGVSPEEAERRRQAAVDRFTGAAVAGHVRRVFREQGPAAALAEIEALAPGREVASDTGSGDVSGLPTAALSPGALAEARERARAVFAEESGLLQQRTNIASAQRVQAERQVDSLIEAMRYGGNVDPEELRAAAAVTGDPGTIARAQFAIDVGVSPPEGFGGGGGGATGFAGDSSVAGGFQAAVDFVIDDLEGGDAYVPDDAGRGPTRFGINATANPDLNIQGLTRGAAVARYRRDYWNAIDGDELPPALALVAFDAAVNQGPGDARRWLQESGGDVGRFLALREADYRSLAADDPARHAPHLDGWLARLDRVRDRAVRLQAFANNAEGFGSDPISFAMGNGTRPALASVTTLPVDAVFSERDRGVWTAAIQARRGTGEALAGNYQVPSRMLTDGEVAAYRDRIEANPMAAVELAQAATAALGGGGARSLLAEVGQGGTAPTLIHIGDLTAGGGDRRFASQAALGLQLKAQGQRLTTEQAEAADEVTAAVARFNTSFRDQPSLLTAVRATAEAAVLADATTGRLREPEYYAQAALGRSEWQGRAYGGGAVVNGVNVVLPRWLNPEYADDALETFAASWAERERGPVYSNGDPMPARAVARLRPVLMPSGRYRLVDQRGQVAMARSGSAFEVDMEAGRPFLRERLSSRAVRP